MRRVYLALSILGAVVPYIFFIGHFRAQGLGLGAFISALFANGAAGGFTSDILISSLVFWIWLVRSEAKTRQSRVPSRPRSRSSSTWRLGSSP